MSEKVLITPPFSPPPPTKRTIVTRISHWVGSWRNKTTVLECVCDNTLRNLQQLMYLVTECKPRTLKTFFHFLPSKKGLARAVYLGMEKYGEVLARAVYFGMEKYGEVLITHLSTYQNNRRAIGRNMSYVQRRHFKSKKKCLSSPMS